MRQETTYYQDEKGLVHMVLPSGSDTVMSLDLIKEHQLKVNNFEKFDLEKYISAYYKNKRKR